MPIYAYRCEACGFAKDVLQKMSDAPLTDCLSCGKPTFKKQVTAAGFQLKGSGWYVTDFRGGKGGASAPPVESGNASAVTSTDSGGTSNAPSGTAPATPAASSGSTDSAGKASTKTPAA